MSTVLIAGGTGFLGRHLAADLASRGHQVTILTRRVRPDLEFRQVQWNGRTQGPWAEELNRTDAVVNLAGRLVDVRPTPSNIASLAASRVDATRALVTAAQAAGGNIPRWLQASTTAIYSDAGEQRLTESAPIPQGLPQMTGVAQPWEEAAAQAPADHLTVLRTSIVMAVGCPAYDRLAMLARWGLGGPVGTGRQWFSWIHLQDWLAIARATLGLSDDIDLPPGVVIAASPNPVRNSDLMAAFRAHTGRRFGLATPAALLRIGAVALRTDPALALTGRHATSAVLAEAGYTFRYPELTGALAALGPAR
ncbi:MAG TPA: DUF1731 domain-containing protein [Beutenbergiaceae bacterium]|nr:DUF1731 domain-containing protein [Beutenbergiaceae bacterium]